MCGRCAALGRLVLLAAALSLPLAGPPVAHAHRHSGIFWITGYTDRALTATGTRARFGEVATDPSVVPLGSWLRIAGLPGVYHAEDTGALVVGSHIDVWEATVPACDAITGYRRVWWSWRRADVRAQQSRR